MKKIHPFIPIIKWCAGIFLAVLCIYILSILPPVQAGLRSLSLLPESEQVTELYFDPSALPPTTVANGQAFELAFYLHNLENRPVTYSYEVRVDRENGSEPFTLAQGSIPMQSGEKRRTTVPVTLNDIGPKAKLDVVVRYNSVQETPTQGSAEQLIISYWIKGEG